MMDFTDFTTVVKKTTKKATRLALKPVKLVTDPMLAVHETIRKTVFGPDVSLLENVADAEQIRLFHDAYISFLTTSLTTLRKKKINAQKIHAYEQACLLIDAATTSLPTLDEKVDRMYELFDELRMACKEGLPKQLRDDAFVVDTKSHFSSDEIDSVHEHLASIQKFVHTIVHTLVNDTLPFYLTKGPDEGAFVTSCNEQKKKIETAQQVYQEHVLTNNDHVQTAKRIVREATVLCDRLNRLHDEERSLFVTEKKKYAGVAAGEMKKLEQLVAKEFSSWHTTMLGQLKKTMHLHTHREKEHTHSITLRTDHYASRKSWYEQTQQRITTTKKAYPSTKKTHEKQVNSAMDTLKQRQDTFSTTVVDPYDQEKVCMTLFADYESHHKHLHTSYEQMATAIRTTGMHAGFLPYLVGWVVDQRVAYIRTSLPTLRQDIFLAKLMKRLWEHMIDTLQHYETTLTTHKTYANHILDVPLSQIRASITTIQTHTKHLDSQISSLERLLKQYKDELRDSITYQRLIDQQRQWAKDMMLATVCTTHSRLLTPEISLFTTQEKFFAMVEKNIDKRHNIDATAYDEQLKTVTLLKTKDHKATLTALQQRLDAQHHVAELVHTVFAQLHSHLQELHQLQKKYTTFASTHLAHAKKQRAAIDDTAKKLAKSPLNQWVQISKTCLDMF